VQGFRGKTWPKEGQEEKMKGTIAALAGASIVAVALALPAISFAQAPGQLHRQREHHFPVVNSAIQQLESTRETLKQDAAHDFHGHKANAINHINEAIKELRLGIQSDRKH
jgi:hypothetical protein